MSSSAFAATDIPSALSPLRPVCPISTPFPHELQLQLHTTSGADPTSVPPVPEGLFLQCFQKNNMSLNRTKTDTVPPTLLLDAAPANGPTTMLSTIPAKAAVQLLLVPAEAHSFMSRMVARQTFYKGMRVAMKRTWLVSAILIALVGAFLCSPLACAASSRHQVRPYF